MTLHLGWCSPLPPARSGIADYSTELLPQLAARCEVTCFTDRPEAVAPLVRNHLRVRPLAQVLDEPELLPVYHLGNHVGFHAGILRAAMLRPGVAVLHECVLHDLVERMLLGAGQVAGFAAWVRAAEPHAAEARVRDAVRCRVIPQEMPLCEPIVRASRCTVTLNRWARDAVAERCPDAAVHAIPSHTVEPPTRTCDSSELRARYRLPGDAFVVGSFGYLTPAKRLDVALAAFAQLHQEDPQAVYVFAGEPSARLDLPGLARRLGVGEAVRFFGYVSETMWWDLLAVTDLCVSLRGPTQGEASASVLKQLGGGKAVCVSAAGPDLDYPGDVVCHIPQSDDEADQLWLAMRRARSDPAWRRRLGETARAYVHEHHSLPRAAEAMVAACEDGARRADPQGGFDLEEALTGTRGLGAAVNRTLYRARLARAVGRQRGWGAVVRAAQGRSAGRAPMGNAHADPP